MTSTPIKNRFITLTNDEILYQHYSYDWLQYTIDLSKGFYETYKKIGQGEDPLFDKKCNVLKFEIVAKFCHFAEVLGAFVYSSYATNANSNSANILENLSKYKVVEIENFIKISRRAPNWTILNSIILSIYLAIIVSHLDKVLIG